MPSPSHPKGALCEETVEISQPSFTTSVGGYSSYLAHGIDPSSVSRAFEAQFHFSHAAGHRDDGRAEVEAEGDPPLRRRPAQEGLRGN